MATELPLNGFYSGESRKNTDRRCVNWYPVAQPDGSLSKYALFPTAGITGPIITGTFSGLFGGQVTSQVYSFQNGTSGGVVFAKDSKLISTNGSSINVKSLPNTGVSIAQTEYARFASSQQNLAMVSPPEPNLNKDFAYSFDQDLVPTVIDLQTIFGLSPAGMADVAFLNGRFVWMSEAVTGDTALRCYYSDIGDVAPKATQFFSPDSASTAFRGLQVVNGQLLLFTQDKTFLFTATASQTTPFQWQQSATVSVGLLGPHCKTSYRGTVFFVGRREGEGYRVFAMGGGDAQPISTKAIDYRISEQIASGASEYSCRLFTFSEKGRDFTAVKIGSDCFIYDNDAQRWSERRSNSDSDLPWRVSGFGYSGQTAVFVADINIDGFSTSLNIGSTDSGIGTEFGEAIERYMISAPFNSNNQPMRLSEVEPQCEIDMTTPAAGYEEPTIGLSVSYDFGNTFESERNIKIGAPGGYSQRTRFLNFGLVSQAIVMKLRVKNPYPTRVLKLLTRIAAGWRES